MLISAATDVVASIYSKRREHSWKSDALAEFARFFADTLKVIQPSKR